MSGTTAQRLTTLIDAEHALLGELAALVEREFTEVRSRKASQQVLDEILVEKTALVEALDEATGERLSWLEAHQLPSHGEALKAAMAELDSSGDLHDRYLRFEADAIACRDRNRQLGQLNLRQLQSVEQALKLFAQRGDSDNPAYTSLGESHTPQASRFLGSA